MLALNEVCDRPPIFTRAEPDDEYPRPEPLEPKLIDKYRYPEDQDEQQEEDEIDENDERNYSS